MNPNNLTQEQIKQGYSTIPGAYDPLTGKLKTSNVITPQSLQPQPTIPLQQTQLPTQPTPVANLTAGLLSQYDLNQKETQAKGFEDTGMEQYLKDIIGLQGETQAKAEELGKTDFAKNRAELVGVENRFRQLEAEKAQDDVTLVSNMRAEERRDTLLPFAQMGQAKLAGDAQIVRALKTSEQNMLNSRSLALQGNMDLAKQTAEDAVAIKYAPYKDRIKSYEDIVKALEPYLTSAEKKESAKQLMKGNLVMKEIETIEANEKAIEKMLLDATPNAPADIISNAKAIKDKGGSALEVAQALGKYGGDYLKTELLKSQILTDEAQRANYNASANKTRVETDLLSGESGQYTEKQKKAITKLNEDVSKNATYAKTTAMRGYADNVTASLSQSTGTGDLAAINQFQKVIDEGAVTRDQDVKLIQQSQSLLDSLKTKANRLAKGEQLSPELRKQMRTSVEALYEAQIKALNKDPYIKAKNTEAGLYGLKDTDTILGELGGFSTGATTNPADNKFGQAIGVQAPANYSTAGMSVAPDGSFNFTLPTNQPKK